LHEETQLGVGIFERRTMHGAFFLRLFELWQEAGKRVGVATCACDPRNELGGDAIGRLARQVGRERSLQTFDLTFEGFDVAAHARDATFEIGRSVERLAERGSKFEHALDRIRFERLLEAKFGERSCIRGLPLSFGALFFRDFALSRYCARRETRHPERKGTSFRAKLSQSFELALRAIEQKRDLGGALVLREVCDLGNEQGSLLAEVAVPSPKALLGDKELEGAAFPHQKRPHFGG
jgi:hypothetical protein